MLSLLSIKPNEEKQKARQERRQNRFDSRMKVREAKAGVGTQEALKNISVDGSAGAKIDGSGESNVIDIRYYWRWRVACWFNRIYVNEEEIIMAVDPITGALKLADTGAQIVAGGTS
jgi:hypothetical protein